MELDKKDKRLLLELDMNARASLGELAKKLNLSKKGVDYKIKKLEAEKIILGYKCLVNSNKLGYYQFRIFLVFKAHEKREQDEFEEYIKKSKKFNYVLRAQGKYNYVSVLWEKSFEGFKQVINEMCSKWKNNLILIDEFLPLDLTYLQNRFLTKESIGEKIHLGMDVENYQIDEIEKGLLKELGENSREPIYNIANKLGVKSKQISYRIKKLEKDKIILAHRVSINYRKLGYSYFKCMLELQNVDEKEFEEIKKEICRDSRTVLVGHSVNIQKLDISIILFSIEEFYQFIEKLQEKFPEKIKNYETFLIGENIKYNYVPFL